MNSPQKQHIHHIVFICLLMVVGWGQIKSNKLPSIEFPNTKLFQLNGFNPLLENEIDISRFRNGLNHNERNGRGWNLLSYQNNNWDENEWVNNYKYSFIYDQNNNLIEELSQIWNGNGWINNSLYSFCEESCSCIPEKKSKFSHKTKVPHFCIKS